MPIYEYKCNKCNHHFEVMQPLSASTTTECLKCGSISERIISASAFHLKGGGWYNQGYSPSTESSCKASESGTAAKSCAGCPNATTNS